MLDQSLRDAVVEAGQRRRDAAISVTGAESGIYIQFESQPGQPLALLALENRLQGIELVSVNHRQAGSSDAALIEIATVFVPDDKVKHFLKRFEAYAQRGPKRKGERRHVDMLDPVASLRLATLRGLWTDALEEYPQDGKAIWWEVWLRRKDDNELARLTEFAKLQKLTLAPRRLQFADRTVALVYATASQLAISVDVLGDLAEVRRAKETAAAFIDMAPHERVEWVQDLRARARAAPVGAPAVCVLDTGVNRGHPLLANSLAAADCHSYHPQWRVDDHDGHGTEMAGLALYGDLTPLLAGSAPVTLRHCLESVKILPPKGANPPELYGAITAEAVSRAELQAPARRRCFSMAVSTDSRDRGQPTSWSAAIDALAAGCSFDATSQGLIYLDNEGELARRLFVVSAGNVDGSALSVAHLVRSDTEPVQDPGQAWNAITVGAFTEKAVISDPEWASWSPLARPGELSPWSTTSVTFAESWPVKPDLVFEGGNVVVNAKQETSFPCPDLCLLSTSAQPASGFVLSYATSAATPQVARMAAIIAAEYPSLWPETVRGLLVHSAEWTPQMMTHLGAANKKRARARLVRRYGFGVPGIERALRSAKDALTLLMQGSIRPFLDGKMRELHLYDLPWPREELQRLGDAQVTLRVTLSYFIEPNPGRRGWKNRYRYASHGLRFSVKGPTESTEDFRRRLNSLALDEDEEKPSVDGDSAAWFLGERARRRGSLHSDILSCSAAQLSERGVIAVYPVSGWWKDQRARDRSERGARYALVVSISTPAVEADIWTPVAQEIGLPVEVEV